MSLLADLLSKVKHPTSKGEIPPNLKNIVYTSVKDSAYRRKIILVSVFLAISIISGILIVSYVQNLIGIRDKKKVDMRPFPEPRSTQSAGFEQAVDTPAEVVPEVSQQIVFPPSKSRNKPARKKSVLHERTVEKTAESTEKKLLEGAKAFEHLDTFERDAHLYAARDYELKKDYPKALSIYKKVLEMDRNNVSVMNNIAYILLHLGLTEESIKYSQMAVNVNKNYVPALINLGVAHTKLGNISAAEEYFKKASMLEPDNQSIILNLAIFYEKQKDYDTASKYYTKLIRLGKIEGFLGLARVYEHEEKTEEALKVYKSIYSLNSVDDKTRILVDQRISLLNEKLETKNYEVGTKK